MNKKRSLLNTCILSFIVFLNLGLNHYSLVDAGEIKKKVYRPRLGDTEFIINQNTGALTNYRRISSDPIIDYISLEEDEKMQLGFSGTRSTYNWIGENFNILSGKVIYENNQKEDKKWIVPWINGQAQVIFQNEGENGLSFTSEGKLLSKWKQSFVWKNQSLLNEEDKILDIKWIRSGEEIAPLKITIAFPRNSQEAAYIISKNTVSELKKKDPVKIEKGTRISIPVLSEGSTLEISFDCAGSIRQSTSEKTEALSGGWKLEFIPDDSEVIKDFSCNIKDRVYKKISVSGLEIAPNIDSGTYSAFCGGMPLFQIYGMDGQKQQDITGNWTGKHIKNKSITYIENSGNINDQWKNTCKITSNTINFKFSTIAKGNDTKGIIIKIPYSWVGSRFQIKRNIETREVQGVVPPTEKPFDNHEYELLEQINGCPLQVGASINLGNFSTGSIIEWFPTESEKISFKLKQGCKIISGREKGNCYNNPFDITDLKSWLDTVSKYTPNRAIEFRPSAFFCIYPVKNELSLECNYENILDENKFLQIKPAISAIPMPPDIQIEQKSNKIFIKTPSWQVLHDGTQAWVPTEIMFPFGLGRNILKSPIEAYITDSESQTFSEAHAKSCTIEIKTQEKEKIILTVKGIIGKNNIPFQTEYIYDRGGMKRTFSLDFKKAPTAIKTIGAVRIETDPALNYAKYKPCLTRFVKAIFPGEPITQGNRITGGVMGLYRQNGEGIDFHSSSDLWKWYSLGEDKGLFTIKGNNANPMIIAEAFHSEKAKIINTRVEYPHYIGLPETKNPIPRDYRACNISIPAWFTDKTASIYADAGINIAIAALGDIAFGCYDKKCDEKIMNAAKKSKEKEIMFLPFFEPPTFIKQADEAIKNMNNWAMGNEVNGKFKPTWAGPYLMCCYDSKEMCDFMKMGYQKQLLEIPNDGIYCDFIYPLGTCSNKMHGNGIPHLGTDGLIDFCKYIKESLIKNKQIYCGHTGYCPIYHVERYCDLAWIWEEMNSWYSDEGRPVSLNRISECGVQSSNIQRILDPHVIFSWMKSKTGRIQAFPEDQHAIITRMALNGVFPLLHNGQLSPVSEEDLLKKAEPTLKLFRIFKGISLSDYYFLDWKTQNVINTDDSYAKAAVYFKDKSALIILGIPEDYKAHEFSWKISEIFLKKLDLRGTLLLENKITGTQTKINDSELATKGITAKLEGFDFAMIILKKEQEDSGKLK